MDLADGVDETSISVGEVSIYSDVPVFADGRGHDFFETRVDNIDLVGALDLGSLSLESHELEELDL